MPPAAPGSLRRGAESEKALERPRDGLRLFVRREVAAVRDLASLHVRQAAMAEALHVPIDREPRILAASQIEDRRIDGLPLDRHVVPLILRERAIPVEARAQRLRPG